MKVFDSPSSRDSFISHVNTAQYPIRILIRLAYLAKKVLGKNLKRIPILSLADGLVSGLIEMHKAQPTPHRQTSESPLIDQGKCLFSSSLNEPLDLLVAGSGPGGAITARNFTGRGHKVLVVDGGLEVDSTIPHHSPEQMMRFFRFGGQQMIASVPPIPFAQGFGLGGGSEINSGLYHRLPEALKNNWMTSLGISETEWDAAVARVEATVPISKQPTQSLGIYKDSPILSFGNHLKWKGDLVPRWRKYFPGGFMHFGMAETYLKSYIEEGGRVLSGHQVVRLKIEESGVSAIVKGPTCTHTVAAAKVCLAAGTLATPEILWSSKLAKPSSFRFGFHAMVRLVAEFDRPVNDLQDIDPHQVWSDTEDMKIGAAVATPALLKATLATKGVSEVADPTKVNVYYISLSSEGRSGLLPFGRNLFPFFLPSKAMLQKVSRAAKILESAIQAAGGRVLGDARPAVSTVHIFGSLPIANSRLIDKQGVVVGTQSRIFVRDASLLPGHPRVNPQGPLMHLIEVLDQRSASWRSD